MNLDRLTADTPFGVFGELRIGDWTCYTVERPWLNNMPNVSCIPAGKYPIWERYYYRGNYPTYEVGGVQDRKHILIHKGNTMLNVKGCIALGEDLGFINGMWAVTNSGATFKIFMKVMEDYVQHHDKVVLNIQWKIPANPQAVMYGP